MHDNGTGPYYPRIYFFKNMYKEYNLYLSTLTFPNKEYPIHNHHQPLSADGPHSPLHSIYPGLSAKLNDMKSLYVLHVV